MILGSIHTNRSSRSGLIAHSHHSFETTDTCVQLITHLLQWNHFGFVTGSLNSIYAFGTKYHFLGVFSQQGPAVVDIYMCVCVCECRTLEQFYRWLIVF